MGEDLKGEIIQTHVLCTGIPIPNDGDVFIGDLAPLDDMTAAPRLSLHGRLQSRQDTPKTL